MSPPPRSASPAADDPTLRHIVDVLAGLPRKERSALVAFFNFWMSLPKERRALLAVASKPEVRHAEVAQLCGVAVRTLHNWPRYTEFKRSAGR